jgi:glutathione S-transferase
LFKLIIGNRAYSSWSMRGWLAAKQSGEEFEELVVPMFDEDWDKRREGVEFAPIARQGAHPVGRRHRGVG